MIRKSLLLTLVTTIAFTEEAAPHGMTPEMEAIIIVAMVQKCESDQPSLKKNLEASFSAWVKRNGKYLALAKKKYGESGFKKAVEQVRASYSEDGNFGEANCKFTISSLRTSELDITEE